MFKEDAPLQNIHEVLAESRFHDDDELPMGNCTFRVDPELEDQAREICRMNSSNLSRFVRGCLRQLVADYR